MKRSRIRAWTYTAAAFAALGFFAFSRHQAALELERSARHASERAFIDAVEYTDSIDTALQKAKYVSSPLQMVTLTGDIYKMSAGAKAAIGRLPLSDVNLDRMQRFLSQAGDYMHCLTRKVLREEQVTDEERQTLDRLSQYAQELAQSMTVLMGRVNDGSLSVRQLAEAGQGERMQLAEGFDEIEQAFTDYPALLYDGPFSDHLARKTSVFLEKEREISAGEAQKIASELFGREDLTLEVSESACGGQLPVYSVYGDGVFAEITAKGGRPALYLADETLKKVREERPASAQTSAEKVEQARQTAADFLKKCGYTDLKETYYFCETGAVTVNYAGTAETGAGRVKCYADLIKVVVSLQSGKVTGLEACGYLMNHGERRFSPEISAGEAAKKVGKGLEPGEAALAMIPGDGGGETLCYEFLCRDAGGRGYLVYINAADGSEEQVFLMMESEDGVLTM